MANPLLRRYSVAPVAAATWATYGVAVPANRALVAKVIVANNGASTTFNLAVSAVAGPPATADLFALQVALAPGEVYTESGIVIPAGSCVWAWTSVANAIVVSVNGEEVDNV